MVRRDRDALLLAAGNATAFANLGFRNPLGAFGLSVVFG